MLSALLGLLLVVPHDAPVDAVPGDGVGLAPNPIVRTSLPAVPTRPQPSGTRGPFPIPLAGVASVGALGLSIRRKRDDPLIVLVHGDGGSSGDFSYLVDQLGVPSDRVVAFDYSLVDGGKSSTTSSGSVPTNLAAAELDELIRGLAETNSNIYSIHHSRGGAVGVEMIADLDAGAREPIAGYRGAALLDPAIDSGIYGRLQSMAGAGTRFLAPLPDDGGFDPIRCDADGCADIRAHLGDKAGVEVVAIRNPDALVTNFHGVPDGMRVYDHEDGKLSAAWYLLIPWRFFGRVSEAHGSVLRSKAVADCISLEIDAPGRCGVGTPSPRYVYAGGGGPGWHRVR